MTWDAHEEKVFQDNIAPYPQFWTAIDQLHDSSPENIGDILLDVPDRAGVFTNRSDIAVNVRRETDGNQGSEETGKPMGR